MEWPFLLLATALMSFVVGQQARYIQQDVFLINPWAEGGGYYTNISVGTPPQVVTLSLDFQDSSITVQATNFTPFQFLSPLCLGGSFDSNSSSTVVAEILEGFNDTWVAGNLITDVVQLGYDPAWGAVSVAGMSFGLATSGDISYGAADNLGLGYPLNGDALESPDLRKDFGG